jgi:KipI family sensor histidine kinase inhibitor
VPSSPRSPEGPGRGPEREIRAAGEAALLVAAAADAPELAAAIRAARVPGVADIIPGAATVLVVIEPEQPGADLAGLTRRIRALRFQRSGPARPGGAARHAPGGVSGAEPGSDAEPGPGVLEIPVCYDGPDLAEVAALTGLTPEQVIERHQAADYRVGWMGFAPGFGYLTGLDPALAAVPRLATPRQAIPAGSVAIAGGLAAVYPAASPGGWRLLGRTTARLWDARRDPPALLAPGQRVRFRAVSAVSQPAAETASMAPAEHDRDRFTAKNADNRSRSWETAPDGAARDDEAADDAWRHGTGPVEVIRAGVLTTIQDLGRPGYGHLGVPRSGAADPASLRLANQLVGNEPGAAGLEFTAGRAELRFRAPVVIAVAGSAARPGVLTVRAGDGEPVPAPPDRALVLPAGAVLRLDPAAGPRGYLAIAGGIDAPAVLGSRSADLLSGLGPRPLRAGDRLPLGPPGPASGETLGAVPWPPPDGRPSSSTTASAPGTAGPAPGTAGPAPGTAGPTPGTTGPAPGTTGPTLGNADSASGTTSSASGNVGGQSAGAASAAGGIAGATPLVAAATLAGSPARRAPVALPVVLGPRDDWFSPAARRVLMDSIYQVTPASNRVGLRLSGPGLDRARAGELPSEGLVTGAIQVPPDGQPILMLADHPVTGGYPVIAVATAEAISAAAHLRPGDLIRFTVRDSQLGTRPAS